MPWHSSVAGAAIVWTRTVSMWHKGSLGSLLSSCFPIFQSSMCRNSRLGEKFKTPIIFCHCSACWGWHFTADPGIVKKKKKTKKKRRKRLAAAFKAALSTALSSEVTFSRQRWSSGNLLSAPPPSMFSGLCQGSSQNTSSWTPGGFS